MWLRHIWHWLPQWSSLIELPRIKLFFFAQIIKKKLTFLRKLFFWLFKFFFYVFGQTFFFAETFFVRFWRNFFFFYNFDKKIVFTKLFLTLWRNIFLGGRTFSLARFYTGYASGIYFFKQLDRHTNKQTHTCTIIF